MKKLPIVAIVGRTNVGKSTLFNKLSETKKAIVSSLAGTTRDRTYAEISWSDKRFKLVDTGGLDLFDETLNKQKDFQEEINENIQEQANFAVKEASLILFLIDGKAGVLPQDKELLKQLQKTKKKIILVVNKADKTSEKYSFDNKVYGLNIDDMLPVSAANGTGCGDLLDMVGKFVAKPEEEKKAKENLKIALIGKPNVGKSTLFNSIIGKNQAVVSSLPHTTRDINDFSFLYKEKQITMLDTAGIRRKSKIGYIKGQEKKVKDQLSFIEKSSMNQAISAIKKSDIVVIMIEAQKTISTQDKKIAQIISDLKKPCLIILNKWDLIPNKDSNTINEYDHYFKHHLPMIDYAKLLCISALEKQRTSKVLDTCFEIYKNYTKYIDQEILDELFEKFIRYYKPKKKRVSRSIPRKNSTLLIHGLRQIDNTPPVFYMLVKKSTDVSGHYINLLRNTLRDKIDFEGVPILIKTKR